MKKRLLALMTPLRELLATLLLQTVVKFMNETDKKFIVIENGQRVTGPVTQQEAQAEANRRNKLAESTGKPVPEQKQAQVKQNLFG